MVRSYRKRRCRRFCISDLVEFTDDAAVSSFLSQDQLSQHKRTQKDKRDNCHVKSLSISQRSGPANTSRLFLLPICRKATRTYLVTHDTCGFKGFDFKWALDLPGALSHKLVCRERANRRLIKEDAMTKLLMEEAEVRERERQQLPLNPTSLHLWRERQNGNAD